MPCWWPLTASSRGRWQGSRRGEERGRGVGGGGVGGGQLGLAVPQFCPTPVERHHKNAAGAEKACTMGSLTLDKQIVGQRPTHSAQ